MAIVICYAPSTATTGYTGVCCPHAYIVCHPLLLHGSDAFLSFLPPKKSHLYPL